MCGGRSIALTGGAGGLIGWLVLVLGRTVVLVLVLVVVLLVVVVVVVVVLVLVLVLVVVVVLVPRVVSGGAGSGFGEGLERARSRSVLLEMGLRGHWGRLGRRERLGRRDRLGRRERLGRMGRHLRRQVQPLDECGPECLEVMRMVRRAAGPWERIRIVNPRPRGLDQTRICHSGRHVWSLSRPAHPVGRVARRLVGRVERRLVGRVRGCPARSQVCWPAAVPADWAVVVA